MCYKRIILSQRMRFQRLNFVTFEMLQTVLLQKPE